MSALTKQQQWRIALESAKVSCPIHGMQQVTGYKLPRTLELRCGCEKQLGTAKRNPVDMYHCQFCDKVSDEIKWIKGKCPYCKSEYNPILAQDSEE